MLATHKLGSYRVVNLGPGTTQARALYLAATLAESGAERANVKRRALSLLGHGDDSDYWPTRALQRLGDALDDDLGFLSGLGWAPRSLAAIRWVSAPDPPHLGLHLASDEDPRVRLALASELAKVTLLPEHQSAYAALASDPAYSVRSALRPRSDHES